MHTLSGEVVVYYSLSWGERRRVMSEPQRLDQNPEIKKLFGLQPQRKGGEERIGPIIRHTGTHWKRRSSATVVWSTC